MADGVIDAGIAIRWTMRRPGGDRALDRLYEASREGRVRLYLSTVNAAEVLRITAAATRSLGTDVLEFLKAAGVRLHEPGEAVARRVAKLGTSLADGFAVATAQDMGARLHTTDRELVRQLKGARLSVTMY